VEIRTPDVPPQLPREVSSRGMLISEELGIQRGYLAQTQHITNHAWVVEKPNTVAAEPAITQNAAFPARFTIVSENMNSRSDDSTSGESFIYQDLGFDCVTQPRLAEYWGYARRFNILHYC
jgi:hypothetical protein